MPKVNQADINPESKPFCIGCKHWVPVGFYTWEREEDPKKRECKLLKPCSRAFKMGGMDKQMQINDFIKGYSI